MQYPCTYPLAYTSLPYFIVTTNKESTRQKVRAVLRSAFQQNMKLQRIYIFVQGPSIKLCRADVRFQKFKLMLAVFDKKPFLWRFLFGNITWHNMHLFATKSTYFISKQQETVQKSHYLTSLMQPTVGHGSRPNCGSFELSLSSNCQ